MKRLTTLAAALLCCLPSSVSGDALIASVLPAPGDGGAPAVTVTRAVPRPARRLLIALDAGHGGPKVGAVRGKLIEKNIAADVVRALKVRLLAKGFRVMETRPGDADVDLRDRVVNANEAEADLFISIHCNAMPRGVASRRVRGVETFFLSADATDEATRRLAEYENGEPLSRAQLASANPLEAILFDLTVSAAHHDSSRLAYTVQEALVKATGFPDRGVRQAPFAVLNGAKMPAILVELGFLSHPVEGKALADPILQARSATGILGAVEAFGKIVLQRESH